ncbi:MAG TPA: glycosyltransferase family 4 protein [Cyclobacteriaceae bacterium]|nr:glycosyltransferase family 4 protein [Cyclobacteriaceae bacterium]
MKVLILHQYFNTPETGGPLRSYYLAKALVEKGLRPVVITTHNGNDFRIEDVEGIEVHYLPIPYSNSFGFIKRIASFLKFVLSIVREAGKFKGYDVCYAISTPLTIGLAAVWIKWRYKIPYLFEVGDLWPEAPIQIGIIKNPLLKTTLYRLEKSIYKRAQSIVALSEDIREAIVVKIPGKKIDVIPNMADTDFYTPEEKSPALEKKFGVEGKFVLSYIGTFGLANGLEHMLACAKEVTAESRYHFILCGDGARRNALLKEAERLKLSNISFIPMQDRAGVKEILTVTDAAFISYQPLPVLETGSPNKYFDALAAGKMIVANFKGWIKEEIEATGCGIFADSPEMFVEKISPVVQQPDRLKKYQQQSRALAEERYARTTLCDAWLKIVVNDK